MEKWLSLGNVTVFWEQALSWVSNQLFTVSTGVQVVAVAAAFVVSYLLSKPIKAWLHSLIEGRRATRPGTALRRVTDELDDLTLPVIWALLQWAIAYVLREAAHPDVFLTITTSLITAWIVIRLVSGLVASPFWSRVVAILAWSIAALNILGLLDQTRAFLGSLSVSLGDFKVTALSVMEGFVTLAILLWIAILATRLIDQQVTESRTLTPSMKVLISKLTKISFVGLAIIFSLAGAGIDLTALTIFSGALGIGVGFGLQKIVANFISGIILLLDKSVKPGDTIALGGTYGWIDRLNARYVSVITRDGTEHLIPNEDLITQQVENWSYTNRLIRLRMPIGISYGSDIRLAIKICLEAATECERIKAVPEPKCQVKGFGDSAINLELRAWIDDPQNGRGGVITDCLLRVWDKFQENGIDFPFPQRDIHIKSVPEGDKTQISAGI